MFQYRHEKKGDICTLSESLFAEELHIILDILQDAWQLVIISINLVNHDAKVETCWYPRIQFGTLGDYLFVVIRFTA